MRPTHSQSARTYEADTPEHDRHVIASEQGGEDELVRHLDERDPARVRINDPRDDRAIAEARQEQDADQVAGALPVGVVTHGQAKGAVLGAILGGIVGALLFLPLALIPITEVSTGTRVVFALIVGALAGSTAGAIFGGGWQSDREDHPRRNDRSLVAGYRPADAHSPQQGATR